MLSHSRPINDLSTIPRTPFEEALFELYKTPSPSRIFKVIPEERACLEIVIDLSSFRTAHPQSQDPRAVFTQAYEKITQAVFNKAQNPRRGFSHQLWLAALDDTFAQYYFKALNAYDQAMALQAGGVQAANACETGSPVPELWKRIFEAMGVGVSASTVSPPAMVLERLILPLLVHAMHDLPLAIAELAVEEAKFLAAIAQGQPLTEAIQQAQMDGFDCKEVMGLRQAGINIRAFQQYIHDYKKINDLLLQADYALIDKVQETTSRYNPFLLEWLDQLAGRYDEVLTYNTLQLIRGTAWYDATRLVEANCLEEGEAILYSIKERTQVFINLLFNSSSQARSKLLHLARVLSGLFQTWPED